MRLLVLCSEDSRKNPYTVLFVEGLRRNGNLIYGPNNPGYQEEKKIEEVVRESGPFDAVLAMEPKFLSWIRPFELLPIKIPKVLLMSDYFPSKGRERVVYKRLSWDFYQLVLIQTVPELELFKKNFPDMRYEYFPMSVDTEYFRDLNLDRKIDVAAMWNEVEWAYPTRPHIKELLLNMKKVKVHTKKVFGQFYVEVLNKSKLFVNGNPKFQNIQSRYTETAACGCPLVTDSKVLDLKAQGWVDQKNIILYEGIWEIEEKVRFYLRNKKERNRIAESASLLVQNRHSNKVRFSELEKIISKL
jgi:hypothetical protein